MHSIYTVTGKHAELMNSAIEHVFGNENTLRIAYHYCNMFRQKTTSDIAYAAIFNIVKLHGALYVLKKNIAARPILPVDVTAFFSAAESIDVIKISRHMQRAFTTLHNNICTCKTNTRVVFNVLVPDTLDHFEILPFATVFCHSVKPTGIFTVSINRFRTSLVQCMRLHKSHVTLVSRIYTFLVEMPRVLNVPMSTTNLCSFLEKGASCEYCHSTTSLRCSKCTLVFYCSKTCQKTHRIAHAPVCAIIEALCACVFHIIVTFPNERLDKHVNVPRLFHE